MGGVRTSREATREVEVSQSAAGSSREPSSRVSSGRTTPVVTHKVAHPLHRAAARAQPQVTRGGVARLQQDPVQFCSAHEESALCFVGAGFSAYSGGTTP
jgi:hypothetical protein